jgi:hypothetical protein
MTAIVYRDGIMAADSVVWTAGERIKIATDPKIIRLANGGLLGCSGFTDEIRTFQEWMRESGVPPGEHFDKDNDFTAVRVDPDRTIWQCWTALKWVRSAHTFAAIGACSQFLYGALFAGASAEETVRLAVLHTDGAGGEVQVERLDAASASDPTLREANVTTARRPHLGRR